KKAIWGVALEERSRMILRLHAQHGDKMAASVLSPQEGYMVSVVWPPILPSDRSELVAQEKTLVDAGIHSRRRAMDLLGEPDAEAEWKRVLEELGETPRPPAGNALHPKEANHEQQNAIA